MSIPTFDGLIWRPRWQAPGEGPYSIVAKLLQANSISRNQLLRMLRWGSGEEHQLILSKANSPYIDKDGSIGQLIKNSSLSRRTRLIHNYLAGHEALRYCPKCIATGFQAAIAQIDGVDVCPIHGEPHLHSCLRCGAKTPPYAIGKNERLPKFSCWKCGVPYSKGEQIDQNLDLWRPPEQIDRLDSIHRWLGKVDDLSLINWYGLLRWSTTRLLENGEREHLRRAIFAGYQKFIRDQDVPNPIIEPNIEILGGVFITKNPDSERPPPVWRYPIPKEFINNNADQVRKYFRTPSFGVPVPDNPIVPAKTHAHLIWRAQFVEFKGHFDDFSGPQFLTPKQIRDVLYTGQTVLPERIYLEYSLQCILKATWVASERIATEWHSWLVENRTTSGCHNDDAWLSACNRWQHLLGRWRNFRCFPVGTVAATDQTSRNKYLYFVVA